MQGRERQLLQRDSAQGAQRPHQPYLLQVRAQPLSPPSSFPPSALSLFSPLPSLPTLRKVVCYAVLCCAPPLGAFLSKSCSVLCCAYPSILPPLSRPPSLYPTSSPTPGVWVPLCECRPDSNCFTSVAANADYNARSTSQCTSFYSSLYYTRTLPLRPPLRPPSPPPYRPLSALPTGSLQGLAACLRAHCLPRFGAPCPCLVQVQMWQRVDIQLVRIDTHS